MKAFLGIGSNLGNKLRNCKVAIELLSRTGKVKSISSPYITSPYGFEKQPWFVNCACLIDTDLMPKELLIRCLEIESGMGRVRSMKWGPRIIDIDILLYEDFIIDQPDIKIPHPGLSERLFFIIPLLEIDSNLIHPPSGKKLKDILKEGYFKNQKIRRISWRFHFPNLTSLKS